MIAICHLLTGAVIATKIENIALVCIFAFLSNYLLDFIPHIDYTATNIYGKKWRQSFSDILKITIDLSLAFFLILIFSNNQPIIFVGAFFAVLSDSFTFLSLIFPNGWLKIHDNFHRKVHFLESKKIPLFWRTISQVLVVVIAILLL